MNRRSFLTSFGALAAAAVAGQSLAKLAPEQVIVKDQVFNFTAPVTMGMRDVAFVGCTFAFDVEKIGGPLMTFTGSNILLKNCNFIFHESGVAQSVELRPVKPAVAGSSPAPGATQ